MTAANRYKEYLTKADEAENQAERTLDEASKSTWLKVAAGYRELANMLDTRCPGLIWWT